MSTLPNVLAAIDARTFGLLVIALGFVLLIWGYWDWATGETYYEGPTRPMEVLVRREDDPARFRRSIFSSVFGGLVLIATGAYILFM